MSDQSLLALFRLFGEELVSALSLLDSGAIIKYIPASGNLPVFYTTRNTMYYITETACTCPSFQ